jgi:hypothetical protein
MQIRLCVTFLLESYEAKAISSFLKAGFKVSKPTNIQSASDSPSYPSSLVLEINLIADKENTDKTIKQIKELLASTKYYSMFYSNGYWECVIPANFSITRKPKVKREVPYLKVLKPETEEKLEN